jgi:hypothetical protein
MTGRPAAGPGLYPPGVLCHDGPAAARERAFSYSGYAPCPPDRGDRDNTRPVTARAAEKA